MTLRESFMTTTTPADPALGFDPSGLRSKYAEERAKRLRADGKQQYRKIAGQFADFAKDPHVEAIIERAPLHDEVDVLLIGGGFSGLMTGARLHMAGVESIRIVERGGDVFGIRHVKRQHAEALRLRQDAFTRRSHGGDHVPALRVEVACGLEAVARRASGDERCLHGVLQGLNVEAL